VRIVLDTNVLVSALLRQGSIPDQVVGLVLAGRLNLVVDSRIVAEYRDVLDRPEFAFPIDEVEAVLAFVERAEWVVADPLDLALPDESDRPFLEVAVAGGADTLVTGNPKHFRLRGARLDLAVLTPRALLDRLASETP
jgi:putative PIN family toxin of toxin-antitoxin system